MVAGDSPVLAFRLVTRVFCSISFFLSSSSAFLLASPACLFFSISSKFIVEEVLLASEVCFSSLSLEIVFLVIETVADGILDFSEGNPFSEGTGY